jgi:tetratricopeptide (TPR) repeat protein
MLPANMIEFLRKNNAKGNLLGHPGAGGYYQWELYPDIKIYIDMEFPPFNSEDLFTGMWWVKDKETFDKLMDKYAIDFIVIGVDKKEFPEFAPQFSPVFLGDRHILLANNLTQGDMVEKYKINKLNPFYLLDESLSLKERIDEVKKIEKINPRSIRVNKVLAMSLFDDKRFSEALVYANRYQEYFPLDPNSHYWVGNILEHLDRCEEALPHYKKSLKLSEDSAFNVQVKRQIGACEYFNKNFKEAHYWFSQSINPYRQDESPIDMYQFAYSTAIVGDREDAIKLLDMLLLRLDTEDKEKREKAEKFKNDLMTKEVSGLGILDWLQSL